MTHADTKVVSFHVPTAVVLQFQAEAQDLLNLLIAQQGPSASNPHATDWPLNPEAAWPLPLWGPGASPWDSSEDELARASWVLQNSTPGTRRLIAALVETREEGITGDELGERAGYPKGAQSVAPVLRGLGLRCRQVRRRAIWHWRGPEEGHSSSTYRMLEEVAGLFARALDNN